MFRQEIKEELFDLLDQIKHKQIIVEGKRDAGALCLLGFTNIVEIHGIYETSERLRENEVLILTDFDREGREIAKKLNLVLQSLGYKVDRETRRKIGFLFAKIHIRKIEELRGVYNG